MCMSGQFHGPAPLPLEINLVPIEYEARRLPELVRTFSRRGKSFPLPEFEPQIVQHVTTLTELSPLPVVQCREQI